MPHLVTLYTPNLEAQTDMTRLSRTMADTALTAEDEADQPVFPTVGLRARAHPAAHCAVADGSSDHAFVYLNLRVGRSRSDAVRRRTGEVLTAAARSHFTPPPAQRPAGPTVQVDEGPAFFDATFETLYPLFQKAP